MFLRPVRQKSPTTTHAKYMPPPTGGWNARDTLSKMKPEDAVILDNYFPDATEVRLRRGEVAHKTGMSGNVDSLIVYSPLSGTQKLFAANDGKIYDATNAGAIGAAVVSGMTNNRYQYVNMGTAGGQFAFICNGEDTPKLYSGTAWADSTISGSGLTTANVIWCNMHQKRLWIGEKESLSAWYGGINSIDGTFTEFPLSGVATLGGYIMGMATWTRDGGSGSDDVAMFVTSEGEAILYSGIDPSASATWSLVGVFRIGKPIGRRFFIKAGADVVLITEDGFLSGSQVLQIDRAQAENAAISNKINKAVNDAVRSSKANYGWQACLYPIGKMLIFNVPITTSTANQYVFNTLTSAACRFTGWNAQCFAVCNDILFYGGKDGKVHKADYGSSDSATYIEGQIFPAFSDFGSVLVKKFNMAECIFGGEIEVNPSLYLATNFRIQTGLSSSTSVDYGDAPLWGAAIWGSAIWQGSDNIFRRWRSIKGIGRHASLRILTSTNNVRPSLQGINYIWQTGGLLR